MSVLAPLRFRDFRLLWFGLLVSNLGTWMQFTAQGYFVAQLAGTPHRAALYLGIIGGARALPVLLLSPFAGVVADTWPRRRVLLGANSVMSLCALALAVLATLHALNLASLVAVSVCNAAAQSFDSPARQSWVPLLVDRAYVGNAIGLNSVAFNAPAILGPAIAGVLIVCVGVAGSFYINAVTTLAVVAAVAMMAPAPPTTSRREPMLAAIRYGMAFLFTHPVLRPIMLLFVASALLVRPYSQLLPAYIVNTLHSDARGLGWAVAAQGVGGFAGALLTTVFAGRERRARLWLLSALAMAGGVLALGAVWSVGAALPVIFMIGIGTLAYLGASNTLIQTLSPDDVRGRAVSVFTMVAIGGVPLGSLVVGAIASQIGLHDAFLGAGAVCVAAFAATWALIARLREV